ncbi:TGF-beta-activated kinase 1 and MAP3K7-binding protein 2-like isoform X1 [Lytechinus pictus]|uniref:TGF-beta-activated kinase 1 and MAP3K7-binding protein 2-like isoform X1 n=2 Tax=Lytechinus pictus TaxID=7653 RepID=UPI0030BA035C
MIMALVEEGVRQRLRQRFSHLPDPVFDECLRTNPTNLNLCITQLKERSQAQERRDPMCAVTAGMDPAQHYTQQAPPQHRQHHQPHLQPQEEASQDGRLNSDGWFELTWPPTMNAGGDNVDPPPTRTSEANEPTSGWQGYRELYSYRPPLQVSKISVNLQDSGKRAISPGPVQPTTSPSHPSRTYDAGNGSRTPGTPDSIGLESSITLPGISPPLVDRTPSPSVNPFFPPIDPHALRASQQSNGRSSPAAGYQYPRSASPRHVPVSQNTSTAPSHYNSPAAPMPVVGQPNVATSHPVAPHQRNTPEPRQDVRRKTSQPERWAEVYSPPRPETGVEGGVGVHGAARHRTQVQQSYPTSTQRPATLGSESMEHRHRMGSQEEIRYNQALIMHQSARKERLRKDLDEEQTKLERMRAEIRSMEQDLNTKRSHRSHFPSNEELSNLREEKRQLQIDIECMNKEIDMFKKQGFTNPHSQEYFYANIEQGPTGPIPPGPPIVPDPVSPPVLDPDEGQQWSCTHCTFLNHPFLDKCECCEMPRDSA